MHGRRTQPNPRRMDPISPRASLHPHLPLNRRAQQRRTATHARRDGAPSSGPHLLSVTNRAQTTADQDEPASRLPAPSHPRRVLPLRKIRSCGCRCPSFTRDCVGESAQRCGTVGRGCGCRAEPSAAWAGQRRAAAAAMVRRPWPSPARRPSFYRGAPFWSAYDTGRSYPSPRWVPSWKPRVEYRSLYLPGHRKDDSGMRDRLSGVGFYR